MALHKSDEADYKSFLYAHHMKENVFRPLPTVEPIMYFNFFNETFSTVDWRYLSEMIGIQMNHAIMKEAMQSSNTLVGLMSSMSMGGPSLFAVLAFLGIFNIEIASSTTKSNFSTYVNAAIQPVSDADATNVLTNNFKTSDYFLRKLKILEERNSFQYNYLMKPQLFNSVGIFLGSFLLFDEFRKCLPASEKTNPSYSSLMEMSFNLSNFTFHESMSYPHDSIRSYAMWMAGPMLQFGTSRCLRERAQHQNIKYYVKPIPQEDKNIHNVLFRNSFPRLHTNYTTIVNNWTAMRFRWLFYSQFSHYSYIVKFSELLRKTVVKDEPFSDYIFNYASTTVPDILQKISFDSISTIIGQVQLADTGNPANAEIMSLYNNIVATAKTIFSIFGQYIVDIRKYNACALKDKYPLGQSNEGVSKYSGLVGTITSPIIVADKARKDVGDILQKGFIIDEDIYSLLAPIFGSASDMGNLNAGFFKGLFYSGVTANVWLRQESIAKLYYSQMNNIVNDIASNYQQNATRPPIKQDQNGLLNFAYQQGGSIDCVKDHLSIPEILSNHLVDWKRGGFTKN